MCSLPFIAGVKIYNGVKVEKVVTKDDIVTAVETSHGTIKCEYFINCAGQVGEHLPHSSNINLFSNLWSWNPLE